MQGMLGCTGTARKYISYAQAQLSKLPKPHPSAAVEIQLFSSYVSTLCQEDDEDIHRHLTAAMAKESKGSSLLEDTAPWKPLYFRLLGYLNSNLVRTAKRKQNNWMSGPNLVFIGEFLRGSRNGSSSDHRAKEHEKHKRLSLGNGNCSARWVPSAQQYVDA